MAWYNPLSWSVKDIIGTFRATDHEAVMRMSGGGPTKAGRTVSEDSALSVSTAWACQRIITEAVGILPWAIYRKDAKGNAQPAEDHPLYSLFQYSPNAEQGPLQFRESIGMGLASRGNRFHHVDRTGAVVTQLIPIYDEVEVLRKGPGIITRLSIADGTLFYRVKEKPSPKDYVREDIWHVKGFGKGDVGLSPLSAAREEIGMALAAEEFGARFFSQGGMPAGVVSIPNWLQKEQRKDARENLQQLMGGFGSAHKFVLFEGGMKPEPWGQQNLADMQFITVRKFTVNEICRFYRIPPHMVADLDRATFSNIEHLSQEFVMFTLMPYLARIEDAFNRWMLKPEEWGKIFLRFNFEGLLRADSAGRAMFYSQALQNGWMNRNEVRAKENLNQVEGLDDYTCQTNLTPVDQLAEALAARTAAAQRPPSTPSTSEPKSSTVSVVLPQSVRYEVEAGGLKGALNEFSIGVRALTDRLDASQKEVVKEIAKGNKALIRLVHENNSDVKEQLGDQTTTLTSQIVASNEVIHKSHEDLSKSLRAKRRIKVGDEVFESEVMEG